MWVIMTIEREGAYVRDCMDWLSKWICAAFGLLPLLARSTAPAAS